MPGPTDALAVEIFRHTATSVVDEIETNLTRTAYSPLIYEYKDYCIGLLDPQFRSVAQSRGSIPVFLADLGPPVADAVDVIGIDRLRPGDIFLSNYAPIAGQHLNNVVAATPIFRGDDIEAYAAIRAHWADVGGLVPGSMSWNATDVFQEGIQFRGLLVARAGVILPEVAATVAANTRMSVAVLGDLTAQVGGVLLGASRYRERLAAKWDGHEIRSLIAAQWAQSEAMARAAIGRIPDGTYRAACLLDDSGRSGTEPLPLEVVVTVEGSHLRVDLSGLPPTVEAPMNAGRTGGGISAVRVAFKSIIAPDRPADEGLFAPLDVSLDPGRMLSAAGGAPMGHWNSALPSVVDLIFRAIGEADPTLVPAGHHATMGLFLLYGRHPDGRYWQLVDTIPGGWGGSVHGDGFSPLKTLVHGDNRDIPIEIVESRSPLKVRRYQFREGSQGQGRYDGGPGVLKEIEVLDETYLESSMDRTLDPPWGLHGGQAGEPGDIRVLLPDQQEWMSARKASNLRLPPGTVLQVTSSGGGGWGDPAVPK